jgi:hypothetical protein
MLFSSSQPYPGLIHIDFTSFYDLGKALIRPQELAESPKFQDRVFTTSELKRHFHSSSKSSTKRGQRANPYWSFTGFNIPGHYIDRFSDEFSHFTPQELEIIAHLRSLDLPKQYYVIASADSAAKKTSWKAGLHEFAHGLWYLSPEYRAKQQEIIAKLPEKYYKEVYNRLLTWGCYGPSVIEDECHAYLATDSISKLAQRFRWHDAPQEVIDCHNELSAVLDTYLGINND